MLCPLLRGAGYYTGDEFGDRDLAHRTASSHGGEFSASKEDWKSYTERLTLHFEANDVDDAGKRRAILLSSCGAATYRLIKDVIAPLTPTEVSFDEIVKNMTAHCQPLPSKIMQCYRFNTRVRQLHEMVCSRRTDSPTTNPSSYCYRWNQLNKKYAISLICRTSKNKFIAYRATGWLLPNTRNKRVDRLPAIAVVVTTRPLTAL